MSNSKIIILAEIPVKPEYLEEVTVLSAAALKPTLEEPGCEAFYQTAKAGDPNTLVFFEVFTSQEALDLHMEASYTKTFFEGVQGKVAGKPVSTILTEI
jgi:quinol monooxygenase YgiN